MLSPPVALFYVPDCPTGYVELSCNSTLREPFGAKGKDFSYVLWGELLLRPSLAHGIVHVLSVRPKPEVGGVDACFVISPRAVMQNVKAWGNWLAKDLEAVSVGFAKFSGDPEIAVAAPEEGAGPQPAAVGAGKHSEMLKKVSEGTVHGDLLFVFLGVDMDGTPQEKGFGTIASRS